MRFQGLWINVPEGYDQLPIYVTFMQKQEWESLNPSIVLVHIGTNDLQPGITVAGFIDKYEILVALLKWFFPSCTIFCSAMLPRPRDYPLTRFILKSCNEALGIVADQKGCIYVQTFKPFMAEGRPRAYLFSDIDKLHVNSLGLAVLASFFGGAWGQGTRHFWGRWPIARLSRPVPSFLGEVILKCNPAPLLLNPV